MVLPRDSDVSKFEYVDLSILQIPTRKLVKYTVQALYKRFTTKRLIVKESSRWDHKGDSR